MPRRTPDGQPPTHGLSGYRNYGCRCAVCRRANEANPRANAEPQRPWSHGGTVTGYQKYGCRCSACVTVHAEYRANLRAVRKRRLDDDPNIVAHGRTTTYVDWGCRCDACSAAMREYGKSKRQRRQRPRPEATPSTLRARRVEIDLAFGSAVGRNRVAADLTQQQLADATGLTAETIANIEQHKRPVTVGEAGVIADALDTTVAAMMTEARHVQR